MTKLLIAFASATLLLASSGIWKANAATIANRGAWVDFPSVGLPKSCFHLKGDEQAELGRQMARAVQPLTPFQKRSSGIGEGL